MKRVLILSHHSLTAPSGGGVRLRSLLAGLGDAFRVTVLSLAYPPAADTSSDPLPNNVSLYEEVPPLGPLPPLLPNPPGAGPGSPLRLRLRSAFTRAVGLIRRMRPGVVLPASVRYFARLYRRPFLTHLAG